MTHIQLLANF